jgi:hypothetical protein
VQPVPTVEAVQFSVVPELLVPEADRLVGAAGADAQEEFSVVTFSVLLFVAPSAFVATT